MADQPLQHADAGQPLEIKASDWNALTDAARQVHASRMGREGAPPLKRDPVIPSLRCRVSWTGGNLPEFSILTYPAIGTTPAIDPAVNPFEAQRTPVFAGTTPSATTDPVIITTEPYSASAAGLIPGVIRGIAVCTVNVTDTSHTFATPTNGVTSKLTSAATGNVRILYKPSGTGDKVCVVDVLGNNPATASGGWFARLTTASGGKWKYYVVGWTGSAWADVGSESAGFTAAPSTIDGTNLCNPAAGLRVWMIPSATAGYQEFLPIGYANKVSSTYYPGLMSTGAQTFTGQKVLDGIGSSGYTLTINVPGAASECGLQINTTGTMGNYYNPSLDIVGGSIDVLVGDPSVSLAGFRMGNTSVGSFTDSFFELRNYAGGTAILRAGEFGNETGGIPLYSAYGIISGTDVVATGFSVSGSPGQSTSFTIAGVTYTFTAGILTSVV